MEIITSKSARGEAGLRQGLRPKTIKAYAYSVGKFLRLYKKQPHQITKNDVERCLIQLIKWDRTGSTINAHLHALALFFQEPEAASFI